MQVYVDESGCDKRIGNRRYGWAPSGVTPEKIAQYPRDKRTHILPSYDQDGVVYTRIFQGYTDGAFFLEYVKQLLHHMNPFLGRRSVMILDNVSFYRSPEITRVCGEAGVKVVYTTPYNPQDNPIEEFFHKLKAFIRKHWMVFKADPDFEFESFLQWCVDEVGARPASARGHFRNAGMHVEEYGEDQLPCL